MTAPDFPCFLWQKHGNNLSFLCCCLYCIYLLGHCLCGFWFFCCCKDLGINEIIWWSGHVMQTCKSNTRSKAVCEKCIFLVSERQSNPKIVSQTIELINTKQIKCRKKNTSKLPNFCISQTEVIWYSELKSICLQEKQTIIKYYEVLNVIHVMAIGILISETWQDKGHKTVFYKKHWLDLSTERNTGEESIQTNKINTGENNLLLFIFLKNNIPFVYRSFFLTLAVILLDGLK